MTIGKAGPRAGQTSRVSLTGDLVVQTSRISRGRGDPNTTLLRHPCTGDCLSHLLCHEYYRATGGDTTR